MYLLNYIHFHNTIRFLFSHKTLVLLVQPAITTSKLPHTSLRPQLSTLPKNSVTDFMWSVHIFHKHYVMQFQKKHNPNKTKLSELLIGVLKNQIDSKSALRTISWWCGTYATDGRIKSVTYSSKIWMESNAQLDYSLVVSPLP